MPIPKPRKGEQRSKFISRCMGDKVMVKEYPSQSIRGGVCSTAWKKKGKSNMKKHQFNISNRLVENFSSRIQNRGDKEFLIVPIVALVEGVHHGSGGAVFYPASEIADTAEKWNGVPLTIDHPKTEGKLVSASEQKNSVVGTFENVSWEDGKLKGEGWIDMELIVDLSPRTLEMLNANKNMEVSTGLFTLDDGISGTWRGEEFDATVSDFEPDHLALLPHNEGACNFSAGCGVRDNNECKRCIKQNQKGGDVNKLSKEKTIDLNFLKKQGYYINELTHSKINEELRKLVNDMDKPGAMHFLREVFDDRFIFEKVTEGESKLFELSYSINKSDDIKVKGDPTEVQHKEEFVPVSNILSLKQEGIMNEKEKVQALIDNVDLSFEESDKELLENMDEAAFNKFVEVGAKFDECRCNKEEEEKKKEVPDPVVNKEEKEEEVSNPVVNKEEKKQSFEEFLATAPANMKEMVENGTKMYTEKKDNVIKELLKNDKTPYSKEDLEKKDLAELEGLAEFGKVDSYVGNSVPNGGVELKDNERHEDGTGVPDMPVMNWDKK